MIGTIVGVGVYLGFALASAYAVHAVHRDRRPKQPRRPTGERPTGARPQR